MRAGAVPAGSRDGDLAASPLLLAGNNAQGSLVETKELGNISTGMLVLISLTMYLNIEKEKDDNCRNIG
jgi:hypothetical protein